MKKLFFMTLLFGLFVSGLSTTQAQSFDADVLPWMYEQGLTKYNTVSSFRGSSPITRGEASKFVDLYAQSLGLSQTFTECTFDDVASYDYTLIPHITQACKYGLLKGGQGKFSPNNNITQAQGLAVTVRSLAGIQDESTTPWYKNYYDMAVEKGIIDSSMSSSAMNSTLLTREKLGTWFYRAVHGGEDMMDDKEDMMDDKEDMMDDKEDMMDDKEDMMDDKTVTSAPQGYLAYNANQVTEALAAGQDTILFFHASWCPSCKLLEKNLQADLSAIPDTMAIFKIDYDTAKDLKSDYAVTRQHTLIVLDSNKNEVTRDTTAGDIDDLISLVQ